MKTRKKVIGILGTAALAATFAFALPAATAHASASTIELEAYNGQKMTVEWDGEGKLPALPVPEREGYEFVGWFSAPVTVEYWGDETGETWQKLKEKYGTEYTYLNGRSVDWYNEGEETGDTSANYNWKDSRWIEHSVGLQNATKGEWMHEGDGFDGNKLYAMYDPMNISIVWHSNGWADVWDSEYASTGRSSGFEYGGKFASLPLGEWTPWEGHEFKGWMDAEGNEFAFERVVYEYLADGTALAGDELKEFYAPATYEPELHLYAKYDDVDKVIMQGDTVAKFLGTTGSGSYFDPKTGAGYLSLNFDTRYKRYPAIEWKFTDGSEEYFDMNLSADLRNATITAKEEKKEELLENKAAFVTVTVGGESYGLTVIASHYYDDGKAISGQWDRCNSPLVVEFTCKDCGAKKTREYEPDGHRYTSYVKTPATCTENEVRVRYCVVCWQQQDVEMPGTALGHDFVKTVTPTCEGTITETTCSRCGESARENDHIPAHLWNNGIVTRAATCTEAGESKISCTVCGAVKETVSIPATGHNYELKITPATCTAAGVKTYTCTNCRDSYTEAGDPATGHKMDETVREGCGGASVTVRNCTVCGYSETEGDLDSLDHEWDSFFTEDVAPTCTTPGAKSVHCSKCGATKASEEIAATGHRYEEEEIVDATEETEGYITYRCSVCGDEVTEYTPKLTPAPAEPEPEPEAVPQPEPEAVPQPEPEVAPQPEPEPEAEELPAAPELPAEPAPVEPAPVEPELPEKPAEKVELPEEPEVKAPETERLDPTEKGSATGAGKIAPDSGTAVQLSSEEGTDPAVFAIVAAAAVGTALAAAAVVTVVIRRRAK